LRLTSNNFIFKLNTCGYSPYVTSSLTTGCICRLQLLPVLARAVIHRFESCGTHDKILLSHIRDSPNLEGQVSVFISPGNRVARLYLQALGSFPTPPITRRATVEVFDPVSIWVSSSVSFSLCVASGRPPQKRHSLFCSVLTHFCKDVFTATLTSNARGAGHSKHRSSIVALVRFCGNVFTEPSPGNEIFRLYRVMSQYICIYITSYHIHRKNRKHVLHGLYADELP
jgi:hypothetical protein